MTLTRHCAAAALIAACLATTGAGAAYAAEVQAPAQGVDARAPDGGRPDGPEDRGPGDHDRGERGPGEGPHGFGGPGPGAPGPGMPFHGGMPPLHGLKLTEAQQDKLFNIMHAQEPQRRDHGKAIRKAEDGLRELGRAERFDDAKASALSRDLGQAVAADALLEARTQAQILAVLTPEQRAEMHKRHEHGPMGDRHGDKEQGGKGDADHPHAAPDHQQ